jgi:hypothetical protein
MIMKTIQRHTIKENYLATSFLSGVAGAGT